MQQALFQEQIKPNVTLKSAGFRPYQLEDYDSIRLNYEFGIPNQLVVQATGLGKTMMMAGINLLLQEMLVFGKIFVIVHRQELATQTKAAFERINPSLKVAIEQGNRKATGEYDILIGSVQTLGTAKKDENGLPIYGKRVLQIDPSEFSAVLVDETHRASAQTFRSLIMYMGCYKGLQNYNPERMLLGFTATPERSDNQGLEEFYDTLAANRDIVWGIENDWLAQLKAWRINTSVNLDDSDIGTSSGEFGKDFSKKDLEKAVNIPARNKLVIQKFIEYSEGYRGIFFCVDVQHAKDLCAMANEMGVPSRIIIGDMDAEERRINLAEHQKDKYRCIMSVSALCLDSETEILTDSGWKTMDTISKSDKVANWDEWNIFFDEPKEIIVRPRIPGEKMVYVDSDSANMRVTEGHRVLSIATQGKGRTQINTAIDRSGYSMYIPVGGRANASTVKAIQAPAFQYDKKARIRSTCFQLKKKDSSLTTEQARAEATRRIEERDSMRHKDPSELTLEECYLIGFWLGDGTTAQLSTGGIEHRLAQSDVNMWITDHLREVIKKSGYDYIEHRKKPSNPKYSIYTQFSFGRGTGSGCQKVNGWYPIEPYLKKEGSSLYWGLNEAQFDSLVQGLWHSDGNHSDKIRNNAFIIHNTNKEMLDLIQAIAACRGYQTRLRLSTKATDKHKAVYRLRIAKRDRPLAALGQNVSRNKAPKSCLLVEEGFKEELVWCVKSTSGNIVCRRNGKVFVTGNCEGYDDPGVVVACMCRPTKSRLFYMQAIGRVARPFPSKESLAHMEANGITPEWIKPYGIILDFCDTTSKHTVVTAASVFGLGSKYDFKGQSVTGEAKKVQQELCKLDEKQKAKLEEHKEDIASIEDLKAIVEKIDLLAPPSISTDVAKFSELEWVKINGKHEISLPGNEVIRIYEDSLGCYEVNRYIKGIGQIAKVTSTLKEAVEWSERNCINDGDYDLLRAGAKWKSQRPSPEQSQYLMKLRPDLMKKFSGNKEQCEQWIKANYDKGTVSRLIQEAKDKKGW